MDSSKSTSSEDSQDTTTTDIPVVQRKTRILRHPYRRETKEFQHPKGKLRLEDFQIIRMIGIGSFARVYLARYLPTGDPIVLKTLPKTDVIRNFQIDRVYTEKRILRLIESPFIVGYRSTFQDSANLYFALEYVPGGELFKLMLDHDRFSPLQTRFYAAEIAFALCDLHAINCLYRDLKPENVVITRSGHIKLADFGCAKIINYHSKTYTLCGTPEYIAPEIVDNKGHSVKSDWWQLGILVFEMMAAYPPFSDHSPYRLYEKILMSKVTYPKFFDVETIALVNSLLVKDAGLRLNAKTIKSHPYFADIDWNQVRNRLLPPPFLPTVTHSYDSRNFTASDIDSLPVSPSIDTFDLFTDF